MLAAGAKALGLALSSNQVEAFRYYRELLAFWNRKLNLTAILDPELVVRRHFLDSLAVVPLLSGNGRLLDVGSGAGLPGIPIKLALSDKPVCLLEPRRKRANFLRQVARELNLTGVHVIESRMEELSAEPLPPMTETITRGLTDIRGFLKASAGALAAGGLAILMQGPKGKAVLEKMRPSLPGLGLVAGECLNFELPFGLEARSVLSFQKTGQARLRG